MILALLGTIKSNIKNLITENHLGTTSKNTKIKRSDLGASKFRTRKEAEKAYKAAVEREKHWKIDVLKRSRVGKLNERDSGDRTYYDFKLVKINERKR